MDPEKWKQARDLYEAALTYPSDERLQFLEENCDGDKELREEVESLLAYADEAGSFLESAAVGQVAEEILGQKPLAGQKLLHYKIIKPIGAGGMGEVYLAQDTRLEREVAIKFLNEEFSRDAEKLKRFIQEAKAVSALNHPNILTVHDINAVDDKHFIATEFINGETLRAKLSRESLTIEEVLDVAVQTAAALAAAHEAHIIHRDIKPENIMLRRDRLVKVLDFGLAKLVELHPQIDHEAATVAQVKTEPGVVMGTVSYMSPEQARGKDIDPRTDIWSLGVVLYEMLAGQIPFSGETNADRIAAIINREPVPLSRLNESVPSRLEEIVSKCLEKDRDERYQNVKDLLIDLRRLKRKLDLDSEIERSQGPTDLEKTDGQKAAQTQVISASPVDTAQTTNSTSSAEYIVTEIKRHKKGVLAAITALVLLIAVGGYFLWSKLPKQSTPPPVFSKNMKMSRLVSGLKGRLGYVSISPDGKYVAYGILEDGKSSLWVKQVSQDTSLQILPPVEEGFFTGTAFSFDGEIVYFSGGNRRTNPLGSLYQIPVLGGKEPKKILDHVSSKITLSPDGKQFAFIREFQETGESTLMVANIDGSGEAKKISSRKGDSWFIETAWSPNGQTIACMVATLTGGYAITVTEIPVAGGEERTITDHKWLRDSGGRLHWIRDGSGLILTAGEKSASTGQIWHISYPEGKVTRITNDLTEYSGLGITSDSGTIVTSVPNWTNKIWTVNANEDESRAKMITNGKEDGRAGVTHLPDGRIVYVARVNDSQSLWMMNADGTGNKALTTDNFTVQAPSLSPDGRFIVFGYFRPDDIPHIWRMDIDGSNLKQLTTGEDYNPKVSPDGKWIVFNSFRTGKTTLWKVPVDGGEAVQITDKVMQRPVFSPDGKLILCWYYDESVKPPHDRLAIISFETGEMVKVIDLPERVGRPAWSADGRNIIYIENRNGVGNIWTVPVAGGTPKQLTKFTSGLIDYADYSPDGKRFIVSRAFGDNEIFLIKDFR